MKNQNYTKYSLHNIKDISSLEELSKHHKLIYRHAVMVTGYVNKTDAKDLVQEFYLKMHDYFEKNPKKKINGGFIATALKNRFIDEKRFMNRFDFGIGEKDSTQIYLESRPAEEEYEETYEDSLLSELESIVDNQLTGEEKLLIELSYDMNLSELARQTGINYSNLRYEYLKIREKIKQKLKDNRFYKGQYELNKIE